MLQILQSLYFVLMAMCVLAAKQLLKQKMNYLCGKCEENEVQDDTLIQYPTI